MATAGTPFALVDAFTTGRPFSGNPAGVLLLDAFPSPRGCRASPASCSRRRPRSWLPMSRAGSGCAGSPPSLRSRCAGTRPWPAQWLWETGALDPDATATFATRSGRLTATRRDDQIALDFPAVPAEQLDAPPRTADRARRRCARVVGVDDAWGTGRAQHARRPGQRARRAPPGARPASRRTAAGGRAHRHRPSRPGNGVVSRYFAPAYGIPEDPATGSAHCTIGPYWRHELGPELHAHQASARGGAITVTTTSSGRVLLAGRARTAASGVLL